ncbi:MAG TPA: Xaa-Pro peptidase family protein [Bryobacteraceae bacterium]|nr:Xaa-Pro peptidase family protein [Bryobacteraceae bacterium]
MRVVAALACLLCSLGAARAGEIGPAEYQSRRAALRKALGQAVFISMGAIEGERGELRTGFFQEPNFYYLTGWPEPGAILVLTPTKEILLLPHRDPEREKWTGPKVGPDSPDLGKLTGFDTVAAAETFEQSLPSIISEAAKVYTTGDDIEKLQRLLPARVIGNASVQIARLRAVKSAAELSLIQRSTDAALAAHRAAWNAIQPGRMEYEIASITASTYFGAGCARHAYAPIVGSGPNAAVLHYSRNTRRMDSGELLLMDAAGECSMYASDITRTVPVSGKFTPRQRELYDVVLGAQKAAIAAIKPGMTISRTGPNSIHTIAADYINTHGKDRNGGPLGKYFTHGLSHHVGLDVHDAYDPAQPLAAGMVITVEPGVYIPEEGIGIRIEDVVLVTENGAKVLSAALPREPDEIERFLAKRAH